MINIRKQIICLYIVFLQNTISRHYPFSILSKNNSFPREICFHPATSSTVSVEFLKIDFFSKFKKKM